MVEVGMICKSFLQPNQSYKNQKKHLHNCSLRPCIVQNVGQQKKRMNHTNEMKMFSSAEKVKKQGQI